MGNMVFSTRLKDERQKKGKSMEQLARDLGVTKSRVNMWENNGSIPRGNMMLKLANYFAVSTDYLIGNDNMDNIDISNTKLHTIQRNLGKLNKEDLDKAEGMLKAVFADIFNDDEDDTDDDI